MCGHRRSLPEILRTHLIYSHEKLENALLHSREVSSCMGTVFRLKGQETTLTQRIDVHSGKDGQMNLWVSLSFL